MAFCTECGAYVADAVKFCTGCGKPIIKNQEQQQEQQFEESIFQTEPAEQIYTQQAYVQPRPDPQPQPMYVQESAIEKEPAKGSKYAVVSTGGFLGTMLLFAIPIIGWLICIIWACGGTKYQNKRNLARAYIILFIVVLIIALLLFLTVRVIFGSLSDYIKEILDDTFGKFSNGLIDENRDATGGFQNMLDELMKSTEGLNSQPNN